MSLSIPHQRPAFQHRGKIQTLGNKQVQFFFSSHVYMANKLKKKTWQSFFDGSYLFHKPSFSLVFLILFVLQGFSLCWSFHRLASPEFVFSPSL